MDSIIYKWASEKLPENFKQINRVYFEYEDPYYSSCSCCGNGAEVWTFISYTNADGNDDRWNTWDSPDTFLDELGDLLTKAIAKE